MGYLKALIGKRLWLNMLAALLFFGSVLWLALIFLEVFTRHGEGVLVPDLQGMTVEEVVSMKSAQTIMQAIDCQKVDPIFLTIAKSHWTVYTPDEKPLKLDRGSMEIEGRPLAAVLIAIHGTPGEDGLLQGYLDMLDIPYQTGDVLNMSLTFSKYATTGLLRQLDFPVAPSVLLNSHSEISHEAIVEEIGLPCFVKPDRSGSSLGISKVKETNELGPALAVAFAESDMVMVESAVTGRELTCGVLTIDGIVKAMPICEVRTDREYFDYEAKYNAESTEEIVPADLPSEVTDLVKERSVAIYKAFGCKGMVRIDHFWTSSELITIEINTVPGFTEASIFPKMLREAGIGVAAVVNSLIGDMLN